MENLTKADELQDKLWGVCLLAAPILMSISSLMLFSSGMQVGAGLTQMFAFVLLIPAVLGIANLLRERAPYLAVFGGALAVFGAVGGINYATANLYQWGAGTAGVGATSLEAIRLMMEWDLWAALNVPGIIFPLSMLILSIGLFRTKVVPSWVAVALALGAVAFPAGRAIDLQIFYHLSDLLLLIPLAWMGIQYLSRMKTGYVTAPATLQAAQQTSQR